MADSIAGLVIDFDDFSFGDNIRFGQTSAKLVRLQILQSRLGGKDKLTKKEEQEVNGALDAVDTLLQEQRELFSKTVKAVPQSMFVNSAPPVEEMDLTDPDVWLMLRADAVSTLRQAVELALNDMNTEGKF